MPNLTQLLEIACLVSVLGGSLFSILTVWTVKKFFDKPKWTLKDSLDFKPPVTILKPVRGLEKNLKSQLISICKQDYPHYQVVYSVQDEKDSALGIINEIQAEIGSEIVSIVVSDVQAGANGKVNNLLGAIEKAKHEVIVISDSDTLLKPDYLKHIVAPLSNPDVGCVCTLFKLVQASYWFEKMELLTINADFIPSVIFANVTGASGACLGPSIAIKRKTLDELGGLKSLADYLVEDYELGRRVWTSGKKMVVLPYVIDAVVDLQNWQDWWTHQVYWDQNTYLARPKPFMATILIRAIPSALIFTILSLGNALSLKVLGMAIAIRLITAFFIAQKLEDKEGLKSLYLLPLRDIVGVIFWLLAFTKQTVIWRGVKYKIIENGKMIPLK